MEIQKFLGLAEIEYYQQFFTNVNNGIQTRWHDVSGKLNLTKFVETKTWNQFLSSVG